ncbi:PLP-dependent aminotransferase family protein [Actinokineospora guangxiensis]|uniref:PLP-dependent aminotransferase family protein n=1 Tax=Actinokineospora guangxiensis TaxID=1490288 RepID=A0ABW0EIR8_9PSEU
MRSRAGSLDLLLELDMAACPPRARRATLAAHLRAAVESGRLRPAATLPSSRVLAQELGVSRGTVVDAYGDLVAEGYLSARPGGSTTVTERREHPAAPEDAVRPPAIDLRAGAADLASFPFAQWSAASRAALAATPGSGLDYPPAAGAASLRGVLADYLARTRGVLASAERVVVCCGASHALAVVVDALVAAGRRRIAMEDPCLPRHREIAAARGAEIVAVPVDADGVRVDAVAAADPDALLVTPAHQYPMGVALHPERRAALAAWAREHDRLVVEDDYDAEFRHDPGAPGALHALAPDNVAYLGTLSKTLAPGLRLAWLVLPEPLVRPVVEAKRRSGAENSVPDQLAFAELVRSLRYDRHLRRMRAVFRRRLDRFTAALAAGVPHLPVTPISAGLHFVVGFPGAGPTEEAVLRAAARRGLKLHALGPCWHGEARSEGVVVGFGRPPEPAVDGAIGALVEVLLAADRSR